MKTVLCILTAFILSLSIGNSQTSYVLYDNFNRWQSPIDTASPSKWKGILNMNGPLVKLDGANMTHDSLYVTNGGSFYAGFDSLFAASQGIAYILQDFYPFDYNTGVYGGAYNTVTMHVRHTTLDRNGTGYRVRWMVRGPGDAIPFDSVQIERQASATSRTVLIGVSGFNMVSGDTLKVEVAADNTTIIVKLNATELTRYTDATYTPTQWYHWINTYKWWSGAQTMYGKFTSFLLGSVGGQSNEPPTIPTLSHSPSSPNIATADSMVTITMRGLDQGYQAGLDSGRIFVDAAKVKLVTAIAGTDCTFSSTPTKYGVGTHTYYGEFYDDNGVMTREPASGTKTFTVVSNGGAASPIWVNAYVSGYASTGVIGQSGNLTAANVNWNSLTNITMFAAILSTNGTLNRTGNSVSTQYTAPFITAAHANGKSVTMALGGWGNNSWNAACTEPSRTTLVNTCLALIDNEGFDGIDFDVEPFSYSGGPNDTAFVGPFLRRLYDSLQTRTSAYTSTGKPIITAAVHPSWAPKFYDIHESIFDQVNVMTYDDWSSSRPWHNNANYTTAGGGTSNDSKAKPFWLTHGVSKSKVGIGIDFNGAVYTGNNLVLNQTGQSLSVAGDQRFSTIIYPYYDTATTTRFYDAAAEGAYIAAPTRWVTFTDSQQVVDIIDYVVDSSLGGVIIWNYSQAYLRPGARHNPNLAMNWVQAAVEGILGTADTTTRSITSLAPSSVVAGSGSFFDTVSGNWLKSGDSVFIGGTYRATTYLGGSPRKLRFNPQAADVATSGNKAVYVRNGANTSNTINLVVTAAPVKPDITSINPTSVGQGATVNVAVNGTSFKSDAAITFSGSGITVNSVNYTSTILLSVNITVASNAATGARNIFIHNVADNLKDTLASALTIISKPDVTSINPTSRQQGTVGTLTITGTGFAAGANLAVSFSGTGVTAPVVNYVSSTSVTANVVVDAGATVSTRHLYFSNGDGGLDTLSSSLSITAIPPNPQTGSYSLGVWDPVKRKFVRSEDVPFITVDSADAVNVPNAPIGKANIHSRGVKFSNGSPPAVGGSGSGSLKEGFGVNLTQVGDSTQVDVDSATGLNAGVIKMAGVLEGSSYDNPQIKDGSVSPEAIMGQTPTHKLPSNVFYVQGMGIGIVTDVSGTYPIIQWIPVDLSGLADGKVMKSYGGTLMFAGDSVGAGGGGAMTRLQILDSLSKQGTADTGGDTIAIQRPVSIIDSGINFYNGATLRGRIYPTASGGLYFWGSDVGGEGLTFFDNGSGSQGEISNDQNGIFWAITRIEDQFSIQYRGSSTENDSVFAISDSGAFGHASPTDAYRVSSKGVISQRSGRASGSDAFTTTATTDTVTITGAATTDMYFITLTGSAAPGATDACRAQATATGFVLHRGAAGTSGLTYNWFRVKVIP